MTTLFFLQASAGGGMSFMIPMLLMFVVFYFFMIRPQQKKAKEQENFQKDLKVGDKVVTISGIHGKIATINADEKTIMLQIDGPTKLKLEKSAISLENSMALQNEVSIETK